MTYQKIVLAGGNGYLGQVLAKYYEDKAAEVVILSRKPAAARQNIRTVLWDGQTEAAWTTELRGADLLINLCGKNVNCRYTERNKAEIFASRLVPTALLGRVISRTDDPPTVWINVTSATIYRDAHDRPQDELNGEVGDGFSVEVCKQWETVLDQADTPTPEKLRSEWGWY